MKDFKECVHSCAEVDELKDRLESLEKEYLAFQECAQKTQTELLERAHKAEALAEARRKIAINLSKYEYILIEKLFDEQVQKLIECEENENT